MIKELTLFSAIIFNTIAAPVDIDSRAHLPYMEVYASSDLTGETIAEPGGYTPKTITVVNEQTNNVKIKIRSDFNIFSVKAFVTYSMKGGGSGVTPTWTLHDSKYIDCSKTPLVYDLPIEVLDKWVNPQLRIILQVKNYSDSKDFFVNLTKVTDGTPPTASLSASPTNWTNKSVTVTITASDDVALHTTPYSFDNGTTWTASKTKSFTSNQKVNVKVRDAAGNTISKSIDLNKIDKVKPNKPRYEVK